MWPPRRTFWTIQFTFWPFCAESSCAPPRLPTTQFSESQRISRPLKLIAPCFGKFFNFGRCGQVMVHTIVKNITIVGLFFAVSQSFYNTMRHLTRFAKHDCAVEQCGESKRLITTLLGRRTKRELWSAVPFIQTLRLHLSWLLLEFFTQETISGRGEVDFQSKRREI